MNRIWSQENIDKLIANSKYLNIYELHDLFEGQFTEKQIKNKIEYLKLEKKKVEKLRFYKRKPQQNRTKQRTKYNPHFFDVIDSKEKAYTLGLWVSDGWMGTNNYQVGFGNNDLELVEIFKTLFESEHKVYEVKRKEKTNYRIVIGSKILHSGLTNLGFDTNKSHTAKYPDIPKELNSHFIRGVFDGDGSITRVFRGKDNVPTIRIAIGGTFDLMTSINTKIPESVPKIYNEKNHKDGFGILRLSSKKAKDFCEWMYQDSEGLRLTRKYERYVEYLNKTGFYAKDAKYKKENEYEQLSLF